MRGSSAKPSAMLEAALAYARRGWPLIPLHTPQPGGGCSCSKGETCDDVGKHPRTAKGLLAATTDETTIRRWWGMWPNANVGVRTGAKPEGNGTVVLDVDPRHGGAESLKKLGTLPETTRGRTGGGGEHWYFMHPGHKVQNSTGKKGWLGLPGLDIKADGGYVLLPPSLHKSGRRYHWMQQAPQEAAPFPPQLMERSQNGEKTKRRKQPPSSKKIPEGERHTSLLSKAGRMRRDGFPAEAIEAALKAINDTQCEPPLGMSEVHELAVDVAERYEPYCRSCGPLTSDRANAMRFAAQHASDLRYVTDRKAWAAWDGVRWRMPDPGEAMRCAELTALSIYDEGRAQPDQEKRTALMRWALRSESRERLAAMVDLARWDVRIEVPSFAALFDRNPFALNVLNGTVDLQTGELRPHRREDFLTMLAPVEFNPAANCPRWEKFVEEIFEGNTGLTRYFQQFIGYALTGSMSERIITFLYGPSGWNGKTTVVNLLHQLLGDYAHSLPFEQLLRRDGNTPTNELARLVGKRLVFSVEPPQGKIFNEALLKQLSGGDMIRARLLYAESEQFQSQAKLVLAANDRPRVVETTDPIWDRFRVLPFNRCFREVQDRDLGKKLAEELPGILQWALRGCMVWQREGLEPPPEVCLAVQDYRQEMSSAATFVDEMCERNPNARIEATKLYDAFTAWARAQRRFVVSQTEFGTELARLGCLHGRSGKKRFWRGVELRNEGLWGEM